MHVTRYQFVVGVGDTDERPIDIIAAYPKGAQKRTVRCPGGTGEETLMAAVQDRLLVTGRCIIWDDALAVTA
jgi:hypothetical protein